MNAHPDIGEVVEWLSKHLKVPVHKITPTTRINLDLGVAGEDGVDLAEEFGKQFQVDMSAFPTRAYFGDEASANPLSAANSLVRALLGRPASTLRPLTVQDLIDFLGKR